MCGDFDEAERLQSEALAIRREIGDRNGEAMSLHNSESSLTSAATSKRRGAVSEALDIKREIGDRRGEASSLTN